MIETAGLLGFAIYEIKEAWTGWDELQEANYTLRTLQKGLKFFRAVSSIQVPKGNGVEGHTQFRCTTSLQWADPLPWCGKEGQNEGTIVNHLWTVHYKLGLICEKCFGCPSIMSEAICHHGQKDCQPSGEGGPDESFLLV